MSATFREFYKGDDFKILEEFESMQENTLNSKAQFLDEENQDEEMKDCEVAPNDDVNFDE